MSTLTVNNTYSFSTKIPAVLGSTYNNAKLVAILTPELAVTLGSGGIDIPTNHITIANELRKQNDLVSINYRDLQTWYLFDIQGQRKIFAAEYLILGTVTQVSNTNLDISITSINPSLVNMVLETLKKLLPTSAITHTVITSS